MYGHSELPVLHKVVWQSVDIWPQLGAGQCHIWQLDLAGFTGQPAMLDAAERSRWRSITQPQAADRFCATRTALRQLLGHYLCCDPAAVPIRLGTCGKPTLAVESQPLFFNLSHTAQVAVLACYAVGAVGIDVERPRSVTAARRIAERVFPAAGRHDADDPQVFLRQWVQHEARQKCLGLGLLDKIPQPVALDFFAGTWDAGWQLGLAWIPQPVLPDLCFFRLN